MNWTLVICCLPNFQGLITMKVWFIETKEMAVVQSKRGHFNAKNRFLVFLDPFLSEKSNFWIFWETIGLLKYQRSKILPYLNELKKGIWTHCVMLALATRRLANDHFLISSTWNPNKEGCQGSWISPSMTDIIVCYRR